MLTIDKLISDATFGLVKGLKRTPEEKLKYKVFKLFGKKLRKSIRKDFKNIDLTDDKSIEILNKLNEINTLIDKLFEND